MIGRSKLEIALQEAIREIKKPALSLITFVQDDSGLNSVDEITKKSFLHDALDVGFEEVAQYLLEKMDKKTIFSRDAEGQTCLFLAAKHGYVNIVKYLIDQSSEILGHEIWLTKNNKGYSPLHIAVHNLHVDVVTELLNQIAKNPNASNHINNTNEDGNMPLHLACMRKNLNMPLLRMLIQHGADLDVNNSHGKTPLALISNFDFDEQLKLFKGLADKQKKFLHSYYKHLTANPDDEELTMMYQKLFQSFNISIYQNSRNDFVSRTGSQVSKIPDFLNEMPTPETFDIFSEDNKNKETSLLAYQYIKQDEDTLKKIREFIQIFLHDLNNRPKEVTSYRGPLGVFFVGVIYVAIESWLAVSVEKFQALYWQAKENEDPTKADEYGATAEGYCDAAIWFGILGGIFLFGLGIGIWGTNKKMPVYVYHNEWDDLVTYIHENLLDFLKDLKLKETVDKCDYSPVTDKVLENLESNLAEFKSDKKNVIELIDMTVRLDDNVGMVQKGVLANSKPFSMFYRKPQQTVIDMSEDDSLSNETTPLKLMIN